MLNKKLVLGSLAGATLLVGAMILAPSAQALGVVNGSCVLCHTMHNSDDLADMGDGSGPYGDLLKLSGGCAGCHAIAATVNGTNGMGGSPIAAPQVGVSASGTINAGGYFNTVEGNTSHSVTDLTFGGDVALTTAPGGGAMAISCTSCHTAAAGGNGHHSSTGGYRMLGVAAGTNGSNYGNLANVNTYDAAVMNGFCATCHANFHDAGTTGGAQTGSAGAWIRHPTNINSTYANDALISTGNGGGNEVMCLSCHYAHGSDNTDLLRFDYATVTAGDTTSNVGCELCHGEK
jgi:predicted CXXCH cytochrome family protein